MKRLLRNKKGGITDTIGQLIQGITNIIPAPLLFILFLFIIATVGWVISIIFNATGIYCNSANQPVQVNGNFVTNLALLMELPDPKYLGEEIIEDADNQQFSTVECILQIKNGTITYDDGTTDVLTNRKVYRNQGCVICQDSGHVVEERVGLDIGGKYCADTNVYPKSKEDMTLFQRMQCGNKLFGLCMPPEHYYWTANSNYYVCADNTCTGQTVGKNWDELLANKEAQLLYTDDTFNPSSEKFIGITCTDLRPKLAIYGLDLLTYSNWIIITVIIVLFWIWSSIV